MVKWTEVEFSPGRQIFDQIFTGEKFRKDCGPGGSMAKCGPLHALICAVMLEIGPKATLKHERSPC